MKVCLKSCKALHNHTFSGSNSVFAEKFPEDAKDADGSELWEYPDRCPVLGYFDIFHIVLGYFRSQCRSF